ncbi:MAG: tetratricopeptide repeat protein [Candidatus Lokiarchaeota archaeon]|nr:tetratricopeptide repeat protein [Candidatus Lokiarchaeota archaeon]
MNKEEKIRRELEKAETLIDLGYIETAIERSDIVLELDPENLDAWIFKGTAYDRMNELEKGLGCFKNALKISPRNTKCWDYKGFIEYKLEKYEDSVKSFKKAIEINNEYENAYYNLACCYSILKKKKEALNTLKKLFELNPKNKDEIKREKDFEWLKDDPEFKELIKKNKD